MSNTYMTAQERADLKQILTSINGLSSAEQMITLGIMMGMRIAGLSSGSVNAPKGV